MILEAWRDSEALSNHVILQLDYPCAHVSSVAVTGNEKSRKKYEKAADVLQVRHAPNRYAGLPLKHALLSSRTKLRCIAPRSLVAMGRTETWREQGGAGELRASSGRLLTRLQGEGWQ